MTYSSSARSGSDFSQTHATRPPGTTALHRAVRHHRRALRALQGIAFDGISSDMTRQLRRRLQRELDDFQRQLRQHAPDAPPSVRV